MNFKILDIITAALFMVCMTIMTVLQLMDKLRDPLFERFYTLAGIIAIISLMYLVTLRLVPYAWMLFREML